MKKETMTVVGIFVLVGSLFTMSIEIICAPMALDVRYYDYITNYMWAGALFFWVLYCILGVGIFLKKENNPKIIGAYSWVLGYMLEFTWIRPNWVQAILGEIEMSRLELLAAVLVSSLCWFMSWALPAYVIIRFLVKE